MLTDVLTHEPWVQLLRAGLVAKDSVAAFCLGFLPSHAEMSQRLDKSGDDAIPAAVRTVFAPVVAALKQSVQVARCLLHLLCVEPPANLPVTRDAEDTFFVSYAGNDPVANTMRRLLTNSKHFWNQARFVVGLGRVARILRDSCTVRAL